MTSRRHRQPSSRSARGPVPGEGPTRSSAEAAASAQRLRARAAPARWPRPSPHRSGPRAPAAPAVSAGRRPARCPRGSGTPWSGRRPRGAGSTAVRWMIGGLANGDGASGNDDRRPRQSRQQPERAGRADPVGLVARRRCRLAGSSRSSMRPPRIAATVEAKVPPEIPSLGRGRPGGSANDPIASAATQPRAACCGGLGGHRHRQVEGQGLVARGLDDPDAGLAGRPVEARDHVGHDVGLAGDVEVVGAGVHARGDHGLRRPAVGADGVDDDAGAGRHLAQRHRARRGRPPAPAAAGRSGRSAASACSSCGPSARHAPAQPQRAGAPARCGIALPPVTPVAPNRTTSSRSPGSSIRSPAACGR